MCLKVSSRNCTRLLIWSNIFLYGLPCTVRSPTLRGTLEIKCLSCLQSRFPSNNHMQSHIILNQLQHGTMNYLGCI